MAAVAMRKLQLAPVLKTSWSARSCCHYRDQQLHRLARHTENTAHRRRRPDMDMSADITGRLRHLRGMTVVMGLRRAITADTDGHLQREVARICGQHFLYQNHSLLGLGAKLRIRFNSQSFLVPG